MNNTAATANSIAELRKENDEPRKEIAELTAKVRWFEEQSRLNQKRRSGASNEHTDDLQLQLLNEAGAEAQPLLVEPTLEKIIHERRKRRDHRKAMLKDLPVDTIEYRLPEKERICSYYGALCMR